MQTCQDTHGGFECHCDTGFTGQIGINSVAVCSNVNECLLETSCGENQICEDNHGGFNCSCDIGYSGAVGMSESTTCANVDECQLG